MYMSSLEHIHISNKNNNNNINNTAHILSGRNWDSFMRLTTNSCTTLKNPYFRILSDIQSRLCVATSFFYLFCIFFSLSFYYTSDVDTQNINLPSVVVLYPFI